MSNFTVEKNKPYSGFCVSKEAVGKRLREAREAANFTRDGVVALESVDISRTTLQQWEIGAREASIEAIYALSNIYNTNPLVIIAGNPPQDNESAQLDSGDDYNYVPFYRAEASAGHGSFTDGHRKPTHHLAFRKRWINAKGFHLKDLVGLVVSGDSMEPTIHDGAAIIINTARNEAMDGNIYVIRMSDRLWVKRTQWLPGSGLRLISDNKMYDSLDFSAKDLEHDDIEVIGQVVHTAYDLVK